MKTSTLSSIVSLFRPPLAWIVIIGFVFLSTVLILVGGGKIANLAFPTGALIVGVFLYFRYPLLYIGFTWWLWFLTPLVRRIADYRSSYTEPSPLLLAPFLVTFVSVITVWRHLPKIYKVGGLPYLLSLLAVLYGFIIGVISRSPITVGIAFLDWTAPILFGFHLFTNWRYYPTYRKNIQRIFLWGVLLMGIYGIIQFLILPEWDRYWMIKSEFSSVGRPYPFMINVWSTMPSNRPFGTVMMAGLLILLINPDKRNLGTPTAGAGYLAFLLARKRITWISWFIGLLMMISSLKPKLKMRILVTLMMTATCVVPLVTLEPFSEFINSRFSTFSELEEDNSAEARQETYSELIDDALNSYIGGGLGGPTHDSGILSTLLDLGLLASLFYFTGIMLLLLSVFQQSESGSDEFASAARAIAISTFIQIPLGRPHVENQGMILWSFLSLAMAAQKYYMYQKSLKAQHLLQENTSEYKNHKVF